MRGRVLLPAAGVPAVTTAITGAGSSRLGPKAAGPASGVTGGTVVPTGPGASPPGVPQSRCPAVGAAA